MSDPPLPPEPVLNFLVAPLPASSVDVSGGKGRIQHLLQLATSPGVAPDDTIMMAFFHVLPETLNLDLGAPVGQVRRGDARESLLQAAWALGERVKAGGISLWEQAVRRPDARRGWIGVFTRRQGAGKTYCRPHYEVVEVPAEPRRADKDAWERDWQEATMVGGKEYLEWSPPWEPPILRTSEGLTTLLGAQAAAEYVGWMAPLTHFGEVVVVVPHLHEASVRGLRFGGGGMLFLLEGGADELVLDRLYLIAHRFSLSTAEMHGAAHIAAALSEVSVVRSVTHTVANVLQGPNAQVIRRHLLSADGTALKYELHSPSSGNRVVQREMELAAFLLDVPRAFKTALGSIMLARLAFSGVEEREKYAADQRYSLLSVFDEALEMIHVVALTRAGSPRLMIDTSPLQDVDCSERHMHPDILLAVLFELLFNAVRHGQAVAPRDGAAPELQIDLTIQPYGPGDGMQLVFENACKFPPENFVEERGIARLSTAAADSYLVNMHDLLGRLPGLGLHSAVASSGGVSRYRTALSLAAILPGSPVEQPPRGGTGGPA